MAWERAFVAAGGLLGAGSDLWNTGVLPGVGSFRLWHRFQGVPRCRGGPLTRAQLVAKVLPLQRQLFRLAEGALDSPVRLQ